MLVCYREKKQEHFSAVFRKGKTTKWLLQTDLEREALPQQSVIWNNMGYIPKLLVGYEGQHHDTRFVGLWVKPDPEATIKKEHKKNVLNTMLA